MAGRIYDNCSLPPQAMTVSTSQLQVRVVTAPLSIAVLDDHAVVRLGLVRRISSESDFVISGEYETSRDLLNDMRLHRIDIVLLDYTLADNDLDGLSLIRLLRARHPITRILVLSALKSVATAVLTIRSGASGFIGKWQSMDEMMIALRRIALDRVYVDPVVAEELYLSGNDGVQKPISAQRSSHSLLESAKLSPREREVIRCYLNGMSVTQIAQKFFRSRKTISGQKQSAYRKLGIRTDSELFKMSHELKAI